MEGQTIKLLIVCSNLSLVEEEAEQRMADMMRIFGWLMAGGGALAHLILICLGFTTMDWGPIMVGGVFYSFNFDIILLSGQ